MKRLAVFDTVPKRKKTKRKSPSSNVKSFDIQSFSRDIILLLVDYVDYKDQVEFISCCREWYHLYMKQYVRRLTLRTWNNKLLSTRVVDLLDNPFEQLTLDISWQKTAAIRQLCERVHFTCRKIQCIGEALLPIVSSTEQFRVKILEVTVIRQSFHQPGEELLQSLAKIVDCESLSFSMDYNSSFNASLLSAIQPSLINFVHKLHHLQLYGCPIEDVSPLGSIPHLELINCDTLRDISCLNNNYRINIEGCRNIPDYSHCFVKSKMITLYFNSTPTDNTSLRLDPLHWKQVEDLALIEEWCSLFYFLEEVSFPFLFPKTVKRCELRGCFVSLVNFTLTSDHLLTELTLSNDTITSLSGYGLERVAVITCDRLSVLHSVEGLGRGRNRKVSIRHCDNITDFTPLQSTPIVEISNCRGFSNPFQLRFVADLRLTPSEDISFTTDYLDGRSYYESVHSLSLSDIHNVRDIEGLVKIPHLQLHPHNLPELASFLRRNRFENNRIEIFLHSHDETTYQTLMELHNQMMKKHYSYYYSSLRKKWTWIRKK